MIWALFNDIIQRIITLDKLEQRINLSKQLKKLTLEPGSKILDFGCGTGLFARVFEKERLDYCGYDIDERFIAYGHRLYPNFTFTNSEDVLKREGPFDLILANCCFHHIDDYTLSVELEKIESLLTTRGVFLMIDILLLENDTSFLHRSFMKFEQGKHLRTFNRYRSLVEKCFFIKSRDIERSHIFSLKHRFNPLYNDLVVFECRKRRN